MTRTLIGCPLNTVMTSANTHVSGNVLDLILTRNDDASCKLVSQVATSSVYFSDHHLITCQLGLAPTPPVLMMYITGRHAGSTRQHSATISCVRGCMTARRPMLMSMPSCSTRKSGAYWTSTHRYGPAVVVAVSMTYDIFLTMPSMPSNFVVD